MAQDHPQQRMYNSSVVDTSRRSTVADSAATCDRPAAEVSPACGDGGKSAQCPASPVAAATGPSRRLCRRLRARGSCAADLGRCEGQQWCPGSVPAGSLLPGTPSPRGVPEDYLGRRPPPSTSSPCHVLSSRCRPPFFRRGKAAVSKGFGPVELALGIQLGQEHAPGLQPHTLGFPIPQAPPTGTGRRKARRQVFPSRSAPQHPEDALKDRTIRDGFRAPCGEALSSGNKGAIFSHCASVSSDCS
jgi:hypothetical protein